MTKTDKAFYAYLARNDKKLFMSSLRDSLADQSKVALEVKERISNPRVRSQAKTDKLVRKYKKKTRAAKVLLDIFGGNSNG